MKWTAFVLIALVVILSSCFKLRLGMKGVYDQMNPPQFSEQTEGKSVQLIDVRSPREYENGHLANAVNIPLLDNDFRAGIDSLQLDTLQPVYIYCMTQHRSPPAAGILVDMGFDLVVDLKGGYWKWKRKGFATTTE